MTTKLIHPIKMAVLQEATSLVRHYEYNHLTPSQYITLIWKERESFKYISDPVRVFIGMITLLLFCNSVIMGRVKLHCYRNNVVISSVSQGDYRER